MKKYYSLLYIILCGVFFSCTNDNPVSSSSGGVMGWQLFDSAYYLGDLESAEPNILFCTGEMGDCYKIKNGVKTHYDFRYQGFNPNIVRFFNPDYPAFASANLQYQNYYHYYYDTSKIKMINGSSVNTITFGHDYERRILSDFVFLDSNKLLIATDDSVYIRDNYSTKRIKRTAGGSYTYFHKENGLLLMITYVGYLKTVEVSKIVNDSASRYISASAADNVWIDFIKGRVVKELSSSDGKCRLSYLTPNGWIDFFTTDAKYIQSISGDDINNFYFSVRDTSGKSVKRFYNGRGVTEDFYFAQDSIRMGRNPVNGEIYAWKSNSATGVSYIYRGRIR